MIACFKPQKSPVDFVDVAARVLKENRQAHFVMAGDGELRPEVERRIREHGIGKHITLLGWQTDMPEVYRNLDIVVLTSLWEGLPCVFSEAMAGELPIVATNVDGAREAIVDGENGFLHEPHDIEGMAKSVLKLLQDPELRQTMGKRGQSTRDGIRHQHFGRESGVRVPGMPGSLYDSLWSSRFILSFVFALCWTPFMRKAALQLGIVDKPDGKLKKHEDAIPYLGGIAVFAGVPADGRRLHRFRRQETLGLLLSGSIALIVGLIDDFGALTPTQKMLGQTLAALVLIKSGHVHQTRHFCRSRSRFR